MTLITFLHRWVGVVLALFMFVWFATGAVIAFVGSPFVDRAQQLAHAEPLAAEAGWLSLAETLTRAAAQRAETRPSDAVVGQVANHEAHSGGRHGAAQRPQDSLVVEARLARLGGAPLWLVEDERGQRSALSALTGAPTKVGPDQAERIAAHWLDGAALSYLGEQDAPLGVRNAEAGKPYHRFAADDGREIVVSARTGEVALVSTRAERGLIYAGAWLHLFRWLDVLGAGDYRRDALTYAGFFAAVGAATGIVVGFVKWKPGLFGRPTYSGRRTQPYREFWFKYHFWAGLVGGSFALLWASSGFLSTNPGQIFSPAGATKEETARWRGAAQPAAWSLPPAATTPLAPEAVELTWARLGEDTALIAVGKDGGRRALATPGALTSFDDTALIAAAQRLAGEKPVAGSARLDDYDSYYFPGHRQSVLDKPLPVLRIDLADAGKTSLYVDPADGRLLAKFDASRRVWRWVYSAVHHWDFGVFHTHALWIGWMAVWVSLGVVLAASAVVLAVRRLRRSLPQRAAAARPLEQQKA